MKFEKIRDIHKSELFGIVVESGCSAAIASALMDVQKSSRTVYCAKQPYNKEYEEILYGDFPRSVSKEYIQKVLETEAKNATNPNINFVLASSWQLIDPNAEWHIAHGWFGIYDINRNRKHYLHFTVQPDYYEDAKISESSHYFARKDLLESIGLMGVNILHTLISGEIETLSTVSNMVLDLAYYDEEINYHLLINQLEKSKQDYFLVFDKNNVIRFEDLMRKSDSFIIQKGSFNPPHHGHVKMIDESLQKYPNSLPLFLISTFRYDKPHINYAELKERIETFGKLGYPLIICKSILFYDTFKLLQTWSCKKSFQFTIGVDTLNRIYQTDEDEWNSKWQFITLEEYINNILKDFSATQFKFLVFPRIGYIKEENTKFLNSIIEDMNQVDDGISSTKIRNGEMQNKLKL